MLCNKTQNLDRGFFRTEPAFFFGKMASSMRATIITKDRGEIPVNMYALAWPPPAPARAIRSRSSRTRSCTGFKTRFMDDTFPVIAEQNLWEIANDRQPATAPTSRTSTTRPQTEFQHAGALSLHLRLGHHAGRQAAAPQAADGHAGAINLQIDEIGSNLIGQTEVLNTFLELYDQGRSSRS